MVGHQRAYLELKNRPSIWSRLSPFLRQNIFLRRRSQIREAGNLEKKVCVILKDHEKNFFGGDLSTSPSDCKHDFSTSNKNCIPLRLIPPIGFGGGRGRSGGRAPCVQLGVFMSKTILSEISKTAAKEIFFRFSQPLPPCFLKRRLRLVYTCDFVVRFDVLFCCALCTCDFIVHFTCANLMCVLTCDFVVRFTRAVS